MSNPEKQYWFGSSTVNVVWLIQFTPPIGVGENRWATHSVWGDSKEAEDYLKSIAHQFRGHANRVYGVPCYGEMAKFLGERRWGRRQTIMRGKDFIIADNLWCRCEDVKLVEIIPGTYTTGNAETGYQSLKHWTIVIKTTSGNYLAEFDTKDEAVARFRELTEQLVTSPDSELHTK